ncbi:M50 family metallopeptidase [Priestia endophytica]|uniref:M50 family metallopeptidase n=1 Tax=Priestia endophytica TaxID=135735 RepID=UPI000DCA917A|nr:M50 family metallopeptidase [Priestia endophytica]RAS73160.1 hypothetical protein A4R27_25150 [Priestia endophytica]
MNMLRIKNLVLQPIFYTIVILIILLSLYYLSQDSIYLTILKVCIIALISLTIHELGHVAAGKLVNMKLHFMAVGFILILPRKKGFKIILNKVLPLSFGMASMYMKELNLPKKKFRKNLSVFYLGGVIANIIILFLSIILNFIFYNNYIVEGLTNYSIIVNIVIILATAIPISNYTDVGKVFNLYLSRNKEDLYLSYNIQNMYQNGEIQNLEVNILKQHLLQVKAPDAIYNLGMLLSSYYCKNHNYEECNRILKTSIERMEKLGEKNLIVILNFYRILFQLVSHGKLQEGDVVTLKKISIIYGNCFYLLSKGVISYMQNDFKKSSYLLSLANANRDELLDYHQENMLKNIIDTLKVEMIS